VRNFHGLASFYRRFVRDFSTLATPFNEIVKKHVGFKWEEKQEQAFVAPSAEWGCPKLSTYDKELYALVRTLQT